MIRWALAAVALATGAAAHAEGEDLCSDRPGLTGDPCLIEPGKATIETSVADWTLDKSGGTRTDTILFGESVARFGVLDGIELDLGWTPVGTERERDAEGARRRTRVGDVLLGARAKLVDPPNDGDGLSLTAVANVSLPAGREPIGAGDWGGQFLLLAAYKLSEAFEFQVSPEVDAAVDNDGDGRHLTYGVAAGIEFDIVEALHMDIDAQVLRDRDPDREQRGTIALGNVALSFQPTAKTQFDVGTNVGLNARSPDVELIAGFTRAF